MREAEPLLGGGAGRVVEPTGADALDDGGLADDRRRHGVCPLFFASASCRPSMDMYIRPLGADVNTKSTWGRKYVEAEQCRYVTTRRDRAELLSEELDHAASRPDYGRRDADDGARGARGVVGDAGARASGRAEDETAEGARLEDGQRPHGLVTPCE